MQRYAGLVKNCQVYKWMKYSNRILENRRCKVNSWCPKCQKHTTFTTHSYYDGKGNRIREEDVCDKCYQTVSVRHYQPKKRFSDPAYAG